MHWARFEVNDVEENHGLEQLDNYKYRMLHHTGNIYIYETAAKLLSSHRVGRVSCQEERYR